MPTRHPSYYVLQSNQISGHKHLFGAAVESFSFYEFRLTPAVVHDDGRIFQGDGLPDVIFQMTPAQFVEIMTHMNAAIGVPVTMRRINGESVEPPPPPGKTKIETAVEHLANIPQELRVGLTELTEALLKGVLDLPGASAKAKAPVIDLAHKLRNLASGVKGATEWRVECLQEAVDRVTHTVKLEVVTAIQLTAKALGLEALKEKLKLLE